MYPIFPRFHSGLSTNTFSRDCLRLDAMIIKMRTSDKETSHVSRRSTVYFSDNTHLTTHDIFQTAKLLMEIMLLKISPDRKVLLI